MQYIKDFKEHDVVQCVYLVNTKSERVKKNGDPFVTVTAMDKTGTIDGNIWTPNSPGIGDFEAGDFVHIEGTVVPYLGKNQLKIDRIYLADEGEYIASDYIPTSERDIEEMYQELLALIDTIHSSYYRELLDSFFRDEAFANKFKKHTAAKSVHHNFVGGLLEHTLSVANNCNYFAEAYSFLNRDLLITAAILHDIGKTEELSGYPANDYTDDGQLLGHIMIGAMKVEKAIEKLPEFPEIKKRELLHCILAHHGELEYGSPKKPALAEAKALAFADDLDAKMETMKEAFANVEAGDLKWQDNRWIGSRIRQTSQETP